MESINMREFAHNMAKYMKKVKKGEHIILMERNKPVAELKPHNENVKPGWKRKVRRITVKGESMSETLIRMRREAKW